MMNHESKALSADVLKSILPCVKDFHSQAFF